MKYFEIPTMRYWGDIKYNSFVKRFTGSAETYTPHWNVIAAEERDGSKPKAFFEHKMFKEDKCFEADTWEEAWMNAMSYGMSRFPI